MIHILNKSGYFLLFGAIVVLPFSFSISALFAFFLLIVNLINPCFYKNFKLPDYQSSYGIVFYLSILYFMSHILGTLHSEHTYNAWFKVQIKLPFLLFPLIFLYKNPIVEKNIKKILLAFVFGSFLNTIYILVAALQRSLYLWGDELVVISWVYPADFSKTRLELLRLGESEFTYSSLSHFFHPAYVAMYLTLSVAILFYFLKTHSFKQNYLRIIFKAFIVVFSLIIILLNSRAGILTLSFIVILSLYLQIIKYKRYFSGILYSLLFSTLIYFALFHTRFSKPMNLKETNTPAIDAGEEVQQKNERLLIWETAFYTIKENFWTGVGIGDVKEELYEKNEVKQIRKDDVHMFDSHNQFLQTFLGLGIFGFLLFVLFYGAPFFISIFQQRFLLFSHLSIVGINMLFESILERSYGVIFFSLIFYILMAYSPSYSDKLDYDAKE